MEDISDVGTEPAELLLDPFAFHPDVASRIAGLGGTGRSDNPDYAFHTSYVEAAPGPRTFTVRFRGLTARTGTLQLRVHIIAREPGSAAMVANMERVALNRVVHHGGELSIKFEGFRGYTYALMGLVYGDSDAAAEQVTVTLDRRAGLDADQVGSDGDPTAFGRDAATRPLPMLLSMAEPRFAAPVTQVGTRRQLLEPAYAEWRGLLDRAGSDDLTLWGEAFVLQALRSYGMLGAGARAIGFGVGDSPLPAIIASHGVATTVVRPAGEVAMREAGEGSVAVRELPLDPFPDELVDYDVGFSTGLLARLGSAEDGLRFVEHSMACLRPGGLMVHAAPIDLDVTDLNARGASGTFSRGEIQRMALIAISRKHEVAQFKLDASEALIDPARPGVIGVFGIIMRRATSML